MQLTQIFLSVFGRGKQQQAKSERVMNAIENLSKSVQNLTAAVDAATAVLSAPRISESDVQAQSDAVQAQADRLNQALNPAPAEPPVIEPATPSQATS